MSALRDCRYEGYHQPRDLPEVQRKMLETLGWKFQRVCANHPEWQHVQIPKGWKAQQFIWQLNDPYETFFFDSKGRKRVEIHYPSRSTKIVPFFIIDPYRSDRVAVVNGNKEICFDASRPDRSDTRAPDSPAVIWLNEHFPDWPNPLAYWD